jgi:hypothetical protein
MLTILLFFFKLNFVSNIEKEKIYIKYYKYYLIENSVVNYVKPGDIVFLIVK